MPPPRLKMSLRVVVGVIGGGDEAHPEKGRVALHVLVQQAERAAHLFRRCRRGGGGGEVVEEMPHYRPLR